MTMTKEQMERFREAFTETYRAGHPYSIRKPLPWWKQAWFHLFPSTPKIVQAPWYDVHGNKLPD